MPKTIHGRIADGLPRSTAWVLVQHHADSVITVTHATPSQPIFTNEQILCEDLEEAKRIAEGLASKHGIKHIVIQLQ